MLDQVVAIVKATGALEVSWQAATREAQRAIEAAKCLPAGPHTECLIQLSSQLLTRQY
jgi:octaprenyl-diphosphate synthase